MRWATTGAATANIAAAIVAAACSAPALPADLANAERLAREGQTDRALTAYAAAERSCHRIRNPRQRKTACASAYLGRAELLARAGRNREAVAAYARIPTALPGDAPSGARALLRAGELLLALGDDTPAYEHLWAAVTRYPNEAFAADALRVVVRDGRARDPAQLYSVLLGLASSLGETRVADNVLYALADLAEHERRDPAAALAMYDAISDRYPDSGLLDESLWHGARLSRAAGDPAGAARRLRALLATREVAYGAGSYFSVWLDDAQLELGRVLRDDLGDAPAALAVFRQLPEDYPASTLRDDALFERAATWHHTGETDRACAVLAELASRWPDSRYELTRAPQMRRQLGCVTPKAAR